MWLWRGELVPTGRRPVYRVRQKMSPRFFRPGGTGSRSSRRPGAVRASHGEAKDSRTGVFCEVVAVQIRYMQEVRTCKDACTCKKVDDRRDKKGMDGLVYQVRG